jgi:GNAT superfamily N-acetyltransferase
VSIDREGWLVGVLAYLKPENRGRGLMHAYIRSVLAMARHRGFVGHRFLSSGDWKWCKLFHRALYLKQKGGPDVYAYWKAVK